jgi:hypothetical protein
MKTVQDVVDWPPGITGGAYGRGSHFPTNAGEVIVGESYASGSCVYFNGKFENRNLPYCCSAPNEKAAKALARILKSQEGRPLLPVGLIEFSEDDDESR